MMRESGNGFANDLWQHILEKPMWRLFAIAIVLAAVTGVLRSALAQQTYPTHTVRLILPFGAASATDITARLLADRLSRRWGKPPSPVGFFETRSAGVSSRRTVHSQAG